MLSLHTGQDLRTAAGYIGLIAEMSQHYERHLLVYGIILRQKDRQIAGYIFG